MGYVIDTGILIELYRGDTPKDIYVTLWANIESMIDDGQIIAPRQVLNELLPIDDELSKWAKKKVYIDLTQAEQTRVNYIMNNFSGLVDIDSGGEKADPFIIALAESRKLTVITTETINLNRGARPRIPNVCQALNVPCNSLNDFIREQGWKF